MTLIATKIATAINPSLSPKRNNKGSIGNRIEHNIEQGKNSIKTDIKRGLVTSTGVGATFLAGVGTMKSKTAQDVISKGLKTISDKLNLKELANEVTPYLKEVFENAKALPAPVKAVIAAGTLLTGIAAKLITTKGVFEAGKIEQKYEDKAKLENVV